MVSESPPRGLKVPFPTGSLHDQSPKDEHIYSDDMNMIGWDTS